MIYKAIRDFELFAEEIKSLPLANLRLLRDQLTREIGCREKLRPNMPEFTAEEMAMTRLEAVKSYKSRNDCSLGEAVEAYRIAKEKGFKS